MSRYGIVKGASEYVIYCSNCNKEGVHHTYTIRDAECVFRENGWKLSLKGSLCPNCQMNEDDKTKEE